MPTTRSATSRSLESTGLDEQGQSSDDHHTRATATVDDSVTATTQANEELTQADANVEHTRSQSVYYDTNTDTTVSKSTELTSLDNDLKRVVSHLEFLVHKSEKDKLESDERFAQLESLIARQAGLAATASQAVIDCTLATESLSVKPTPSVRTSTVTLCPPSLCGKPQVFDGRNLENFLLLVENYTHLHSLEQQQKLAVLVSFLGPALTTYRTWISTNPSGSYVDLVEHLRIIYVAQPNTLMAKVNFRNTKRKVGQSFEDYLTTLQESALLAYQGQGPSSITSAVIEQFLLGLQDKKVQEVLMQHDYVNAVVLLQRAQKVRDSISVVNEAVDESKLRPTAAPRVNLVVPPPIARPRATNMSANRGVFRCFNCGSTTHRASECSLPSQLICHNCKLVGHGWQQCTRFPPASGNGRPGMFQGPPNPGRFQK
jgi:hypothetical protein